MYFVYFVFTKFVRDAKEKVCVKSSSSVKIVCRMRCINVNGTCEIIIGITCFTKVQFTIAGGLCLEMCQK